MRGIRREVKIIINTLKITRYMIRGLKTEVGLVIFVNPSLSVGERQQGHTPINKFKDQQ